MVANVGYLAFALFYKGLNSDELGKNCNNEAHMVKLTLALRVVTVLHFII